MKKSIRLLTAGLLTLIALSCQQKEIDRNNNNKESGAYATYKINITGEESTNATKSLLTVDEDDVKSINLYAFDPETGDILLYGGNAGPSLEGTPVKAYISGAIRSFEWSLPINQPLDIYAVCNINEISTTPGNVDELMSLDEMNYTIGDISDLNENGIPMTGIVESFNDDGSGNIITIPVRRIVAKYTLAIKEIFSGFEVLDVRICNVNSRTTLFGENEAATSASSLIAKGDWAGQDDLNDLNQGNQVAFYMLENMQTTANRVSANVSKWYDVHEHFNLKNKGQYCTHLEIYCTNGAETRTTRLYLGKDCTTNFDIVRNTVKNITIKAIDLIEPDRTTSTDNITFDNPTSTIVAGETLEVGFGYAFNLNPDRADDIEFRIEPSSAPVTISDYSINNDGTGTVKLQCDASASAQTVTLWGGVENVATATMEVNVEKGTEITYEAELIMNLYGTGFVGDSHKLVSSIIEIEYVDGVENSRTRIPIYNPQLTRLNIYPTNIASFTGIGKTTIEATQAGTITISGEYRNTEKGYRATATLKAQFIDKNTTLTLKINDLEEAVTSISGTTGIDETWDLGIFNESLYDLSGGKTPTPSLYCFEGDVYDTIEGTVEQWSNVYQMITEYDYESITLTFENKQISCENSSLFLIIKTMIDNQADAEMNWLDDNGVIPDVPDIPITKPTITTKIWFEKLQLSGTNNAVMSWNSDKVLQHTLYVIPVWSINYDFNPEPFYMYEGTSTDSIVVGDYYGEDVGVARNNYPDESTFQAVMEGTEPYWTPHPNYSISTNGQTVIVQENDANYMYIMEF